MASPSVLFSANTSLNFTTAIEYLNLGGLLINNETTEASAQIAAPAAFTASKMGINVTANTVTGTPNVTLRNGGVSVNQTIALASAGTGQLSDSSHSDSIAAAALLTVKYAAASGGSIGIAALGFEMVAATTGFTLYVCGYGSWGLAMGATAYFPLIGYPNSSSSGATEAQVYQKMRAAGTSSKLSITIQSVSSTGHSVQFRNNGANKNQIITGFSTTGVLTDSSHTDSIAAADVCSSVTSASQACSWNIITYMLAPSSTPTQDLGGNFGAQTFAAATTGFIPLAGEFVSVATEPPVQFSAQTAATASNMRFNATATTGASLTVTFRIGAADKNQALSVSSGTVAGWQEDVSHTDSIVAGNLYNEKWVSGAGSASGIGGYLVSLALPSPAAKGGFFHAFP